MYLITKDQRPHSPHPQDITPSAMRLSDAIEAGRVLTIPERLRNDRTTKLLGPVLSKACLAAGHDPSFHAICRLWPQLQVAATPPCECGKFFSVILALCHIFDDHGRDANKIDTAVEWLREMEPPRARHEVVTMRAEAMGACV